MKIWYQSSAPLGRDPSWKLYEEFLITYVKKMARPGTTIDVHGLNTVHPAEEKSHYVEYLNTEKWIENACTSESEGYDAFAGGCMLDPGFLQIREIVDIPVVFAAEASFLFACLFAHRFSLLVHSQPFLLHAEERIRQYGLWDRYVPGDYFDITMDELRDNFDGSVSIIESVKRQVKTAIERGAGILVPSCNILGMFLMNSGVTQIEGVPILDNVGVVVKMSELLVDLKELGIDRSKTGFYSSIPKQELMNLRGTIEESRLDV